MRWLDLCHPYLDTRNAAPRFEYLKNGAHSSEQAGCCTRNWRKENRHIMLAGGVVGDERGGM